MTGLLALVGGGEFTDACIFDRSLLAAANTDEVVLLPTGAAYEHPQLLVGRARSWFSELGAKVRALDVLRRPDALDAEHAAAVRDAKFVYLAGGSSQHLRSVLSRSAVWDALVEAWSAGAVVAGAEAGAQVLGDPMVDSRGGAFTLGLGLLPGLAVIAEHDRWSEEVLHRTRALTPADVTLLGIDTATAAIRQPDGSWSAEGAGTVSAHRGSDSVELSEVRL